MRRITGKWSQVTGIVMLVLALICPAAFAQEISAENNQTELTLEALQQMPLKAIPQANGDTFWQRNRSDVERIIGYVAGQSSGLADNENLWLGYLEKPHPSVKTMQRYFTEAAQEFGVPAELLQAIGQVENNWTQIGPSIDQGWGVMHLVQNDYADTLGEAAMLLGVDGQVLKDEPQQNIRGAAALLAKYAGAERSAFTKTEDWFPAVKRFSALIDEPLQEMQAERYFAVLQKGSSSPTLWNETVQLAAHPEVNLQANRPQPTTAQPVASTDYAPALTNLTSCNYTGGRTRSLDTWVNHWIGTGTYGGAISWFHKCRGNQGSSAHFVISNGGEITQVVRVSNTAWHAGASGYPNNPRSIGVEHDATAVNPGLWNSTAMLQASAKMARYFADKYGIPKQRALPGIRGHNEMPGTSTACPGNLPWATWMAYFNGNGPAQPKLTGGLWVYTNNPSSYPIEYGQWMEASFKVKNFGGQALTFKNIGVGGRSPGANGGTNPTVVCDLGWQTNLTLQPNEEKEIWISANNYGCNNIWGTYQLSAYYQLADDSWYKIPAGAAGAQTDVNFQIVAHAAAVQLANGVGKAEYVPRKGYDQFYVDVPANTATLTITTTQARSGDYLNLYAKAGALPTTAVYDYKAASSASNESITIANPAAGRYGILVDGYYNGGSERGTPYTITATWQNPTLPTPKTLTLVSDPGTYLEETGQGAAAAWISPYWNQSLVDPNSGATWIWSSYYTTTNENQFGAVRTFREPFTIPAGAKNIQGAIDIASDDTYQLFLNGASFAQGGDHRNVSRHLFTPQVGNNVLRIATTNVPNGSLEPTRNAAGVIYKATLSYDLAHTLAVSKAGDGTGSVNGPGINCGNDCTEDYGDNATVTLTASAANGSSFAGWNGGCTGTADCTLTMKGAQNVTANFTLNAHTITASAGAEGVVAPSGVIPVKHGASQSFTITPQAGYRIAAILVDGTTVNSTSPYLFTNVTADHALKVYFTKAKHTITATAGANGALTPAGGIAVTDGANQAFAITPNAGYQIADVQVDGTSVGKLAAYTFTNVTADHRLTASFEALPPDAVTLTMDDSQGKPGDVNVPIAIALDNAATPVSSMQFRILYDASKGIHAIAGSAGYKLTPRTQGFVPLITVAENGANSEMLVLLYSVSGGTIAAGTGAILEILMNVDAAANPGDTTTLKFTQGLAADAAARPIGVNRADTAAFTIEQPYQPGDINQDGAINVLDLQMLINCISANGSCDRCDLNGDGLQNVLDVQLLLNKINNQPGTVSAGAAIPSVGGINLVKLPALQLQPGTTGTLGITLTNDDPVAAGQLTLMYDATTGFDLTGVHFTDRTTGFSEPIVFRKDASDPANVKVLVLFFALGGNVITPGSGEILEFSYQTTPTASGAIGLALTESLFAAQDGNSTPAASDNGEILFQDWSRYTISASAGVGGSLAPSGSVYVKAGADQTFDITPEQGYAIKDVLVDGVSQGIVTTYLFTNLTADHALEVVFRAVSAGNSFLREDWRDVDKSLTNPDDDWLCWAAAAANILDWADWTTPLADSAQDIFYTFQNYWTNAGGLMEYGWHWWFDGAKPLDLPGWAQLNQGQTNVADGGGYWKDYNFFDYFHEDWATWNADAGQWSNGASLMNVLDEYLHQDYGVTLAVYSENGGHALTGWGYEYDDSGNYTGLWVTDSDDYTTGLKLLSVTLDAENGLWYLDAENQYNYQGWFIGGVQALDRNAGNAPVPEPGTLMLLGFGLFSLIALKRRNFQARRK